MIRRLMDRLHRVFNRDPQAVPVVTISGVSSVEVKGLRLLVDGEAIDIATITLEQLVTALQVIPVTAALTDASHGTLLARGLLESYASGSQATLSYPTSLLYNEMQVYAWMLQGQADRITDLERQLYLNTADGDWLDFWGMTYFGVGRYTGETDEVYATRIKNEILRATQNNVALAQIVQDATGVRCQLRDAALYPLEVDPADAPGRFILDLYSQNWLTPEERAALDIKVFDLVRRYKAAGTDFQPATIMSEGITEEITVSEVVDVQIQNVFNETPYADGPIYLGRGFRLGSPNILLGTNDRIVEQVVVCVLSADNTQVLARYFLDGGQ